MLGTKCRWLLVHMGKTKKDQCATSHRQLRLALDPVLYLVLLDPCLVRLMSQVVQIKSTMNAGPDELSLREGGTSASVSGYGKGNLDGHTRKREEGREKGQRGGASTVGRGKEGKGGGEAASCQDGGDEGVIKRESSLVDYVY